MKSKGRGSGNDSMKSVFSFDRNIFVLVSEKNESKNGSKNANFAYWKVLRLLRQIEYRDDHDDRFLHHVDYCDEDFS